MLNNKGQSLILFVLFIPILLLVLILVIDIGKIINLKTELDNISNIVLDYGLDNLEKEGLTQELEELVKLNKSDIDNVFIKKKDNKIYIELETDSDGMFLGIIDVSINSIKSSYVGYIDNDKKRVERIVGD